jgi:uncharacterized membrane protein YgdD (TMEM256/DUF423 family)
VPPLLRYFVFTGCLLAGLAVACGAFGAHGLKSRFTADGSLDEADEQQLANWETAARYQMYHALALLVLGTMVSARPTRMANAAAAAFVLGTLIFSGCLYALVLTGQRWLGAIVPIGGTLLIVGWICFALALANSSPGDESRPSSA